MRTLSFFVLAAMMPLAAHATPLFQFAELKETTSLSIPTDDASATSIGAAAGTRVVLGDKKFSVDARTFITLPKTKWSAFQAMDSPADFFAAWNEPRYGAGLTLPHLPFPVTVKAGMMSFSKSISRLSNPMPSATANPLATSFGFSAGIGANLPTVSSAVKPRALFAMISVPQKRWGIPVSAQIAADENATALAATNATFSFGKYLSLQAAATAGRFLVRADSTTTKLLADSNAAFEEQWLYAASVESAFRSPFLKANLFIGLHQTPFSADFASCSAWIKSAARTAYRNLLVDVSYFAVPTLSLSPKPLPLLGGSSTVCRTLQQLGINPQLQWALHNAYAATLHVGVHALAEKKILATREAEQYSTLKLSVGLAYKSKPFTTKITGSATNIILDGRFLTDSTTPDQTYAFDITSSLALDWLNASVSLGYDRSPKSTKTGNTKDSFSVDIAASPGRERMMTFTGGASIAYKNGEKTSSSWDTSATFRFKTDYVRTTLKCAITWHQ